MNNLLNQFKIKRIYRTRFKTTQMLSQTLKQTHHKETQKQRNIKYRRKKNFIKKGCQLASICGLEIIIITYDKTMNKFHEYYTSPEFQFEDAQNMVHNGVTSEMRKIKPVSINVKSVHEKLAEDD